MAAILVLEDGRSFRAPSLGFSGMLTLISKHVDTRAHARLRTWLADVSDRTAPFMDFDVRGFAESDRGELWRCHVGVARTTGIAREQYVESGESPSAGLLNRLVRMHQAQRAGQPHQRANDVDDVREFDGRKINLEDIWGGEV